MALPIIIPFYKDQVQLDKCVAAIGAQDTPSEPWIYDNNVDNRYYTKAQNLGLKRALKEGLEFAVCGTQDVYMRPDCVTQMLKFMREHPRCAFAGPKQVLAADEDYIIHGGCTIAYPGGRHYYGRKSLGQCNVSAKMPWVNGAIIFCRMEAVIEIGLMDEGMLMIGSDSDWCYTARARNWEVWYVAEAEVIHEAGVSSKPTAAMQPIFTNDMNYWRDKWIGSGLHARLFYEFAPKGTPIQQGSFQIG